MMRRWNRLFIEHPNSVNETYGQHFGMAAGFGVRMIGGGVACLVHAVLPFAFTRTGSRTIADLHHRLTARRNVAEAAPQATWTAGQQPSGEVAPVLRREGGA